MAEPNSPSVALQTRPVHGPRARARAAGAPTRTARHRRRTLAVDGAAAAAGVGLGITVALAIGAESSGTLSAPGGIATALGRLSGLVGAYGLLIAVLLVARLPWIERAVGQDRLVAWHRRLAPWPLFLLGAHGGLIAVGYGQAAGTGPLHQMVVLLGSYSGVLAATAGFGLLTMAGVTSYRLARRRMSHETWWAVHLYTYLAIALSFSHQISTGAAFVGHPLVRAWWIALYALVLGAVLAHRIGTPVWRSFNHRLRVLEVREEGAGAVSLLCEGRRLEQLAVAGGQFFQWRFLERGLWWQAHPYSISAMPRSGQMRVTVKDLGDHSGGISRLRPGTPIAIEGPYGTFTAGARRGDSVLLVGAGVGATPIRALLEDLPSRVDTEVLLRASSREEMVLRDEIEELVSRRGGLLHELVGPRERVRTDPTMLHALVPDIAERDVYICGPVGFANSLESAARKVGVRPDRIHRESFAG